MGGKLGLAYRFERDKYVPTITCDTCENPIEDWAGAIVTSPWPTNGEKTIQVTVYHRGDCDPEPRGKQPFLPLNLYLPWLIGNNKWGERSEAGDELTVPYSQPF